MSAFDSNPSNIATLLQLAQREIFETYGVRTVIGRKSIRKYGRNPSVSSASEVDVNHFGGTEAHIFTNGIDTISSDDAADTSKSIYIEGMTITTDANGDYQYAFVSQTATTDASNGQTKVTLSTPLAECTRVRGVCAGTLYVYEDTAISVGVPTDTSKIHNTLIAGDNSSLKAGTAVSGTNYAIIVGYWNSLGKAAGSVAGDFRLKIAYINDPILGTNFYTENIYSQGIGIDSSPPTEPYIIVRPNSLIQQTAVVSSGTVAVNSGFNIFFADVIDGSNADLGNDGWEMRNI